MNCMFLPINFILSIRREVPCKKCISLKNISLFVDLMEGCGVYSHFGFNPKEGRETPWLVLGRGCSGGLVHRTEDGSRRYLPEFESQHPKRVPWPTYKNAEGCFFFTTKFRSVFFVWDRFRGRRKGNREVAATSLLQKSSLKPIDERSRIQTSSWIVEIFGSRWNVCMKCTV